jgi:hypothetical protein
MYIFFNSFCNLWSIDYSMIFHVCCHMFAFGKWVWRPVAVAEWSKAWTVLARLDGGIVCSNPTLGMDIYMYVYVYSMFVLSYVGRGLVMSWSLIQGVLPCVAKIDFETQKGGLGPIAGCCAKEKKTGYDKSSLFSCFLYINFISFFTR